MNEHELVQQRKRAGDEIELKELVGVLWVERWLIIGVTSLAALISVVTSLMLTEIYRAETVLASADTEQSSGMMAQLGGAAALLGVTMGSNSDTNINTAIATLRSHQFITRFIEQNNLLVPLFASSWDKQLKQPVIDDTAYDLETGEWLLDNGKPSNMDAYRKFMEILAVVGPDINTGLVRVAINWKNPQEAAIWANQLVRELNHEIRARDVREASRAISFLQLQLQNTQLVDMQKVFYQLIESQTRITMLADVREEYVFRVIDPAVEPDMKSEPRRGLICIIGTMSGAILSMLIVVIRRLLKLNITN